MKRRHFLAALAATAGEAAADPNEESKILLPTDTPDEYGFRIMWYNPVPPIDQANYRLKVSGLVEKPLELSMDELRALPQVSQNSRMKCVQCWSSRATWGGFRFEPFLDRVKPKKTAQRRPLRLRRQVVRVHVDGGDAVAARAADARPGRQAARRQARRAAAAARPFEIRLQIRQADHSRSPFVEEGKGSMACDIGPYYSPTGEILPGYDHPLDLGANVRKKIRGGEITEY